MTNTSRQRQPSGALSSTNLFNWLNQYQSRLPEAHFGKGYFGCTKSHATMLLGNADETGFMYLDTGYPDFIRHIDPKLVLDRLQRLRMMRPNLILITESEYNQVDFFKRLRIQVELLFE
jgi:hypothetical protein